MAGNTIEIYEDAAGEYRWRHEMCGQILARSSEGYVGKADCLNGAFNYKSVRVFDSIRAQHTFESFFDAAGELRWRLRHQNGNIIATPATGYTDLSRFLSDLVAIDGYAARAQIVDRTDE